MFDETHCQGCKGSWHGLRTSYNNCPGSWYWTPGFDVRESDAVLMPADEPTKVFHCYYTYESKVGLGVGNSREEACDYAVIDWERKHGSTTNTPNLLGQAPKFKSLGGK